MKLNNKIASLLDNMEAFKGEIPQQYWDVYLELSALIRVQLYKFEQIKTKEIQLFNQKAKTIDIDVIKIKNK